MAKIIVIGGGVGGLSAGIYGALAGHSVTVIERHGVAGGNLTGWRRGGYTIDNCIHWLTGTNPATDTYKTWVDLGALGDTEIIKCNTLYTYSDGARRFSLTRDLDEVERRMLEISPMDRREILALVRAVRALQGYSGIGGPKHDRGMRPREILSAAPALLRYYNSNCLELSRRFKSPLLSGFIRSFLGECFSSLALVLVFAHFTAGNADLPRGGSIEMAKRIADRFKSLGGELILNAEVTKVNHRDGVAYSALLADGREINGDYFVFTADPMPNYEKLFSLPLPASLKKSYDRGDMLRFSSYHTAFAVDGTLPFSGDYVFPLPDRSKIKLMADNLILRDFSHEPSYSPEGKSILQTLVFVNEPSSKAFISLKKKDEESYKIRKERLAGETKKAIEEHFPSLAGRLELIDVWTPSTYERYTGAQIGSYMGFALPKKCIPKRSSSEIPELENAFLATQWQLAPGGLPTAAELGKLAIKKICAKEAAKFKRKGLRRRYRPRPAMQS